MSARAKRAQRRAQNPLPPLIGRAITDSDVLEQLKAVWPLGLTRKEIATALGRQVTPTLIARIEKFADAGYFTRDLQIWPNGARGYKYTYVMTPAEMQDADEAHWRAFVDEQNKTR